MADLAKGYAEKKRYNLADLYMDEAAVAPEIIMFAYDLASRLSKMADKADNKEEIDKEVKGTEGKDRRTLQRL